MKEHLVKYYCHQESSLPAYYLYFYFHWNGWQQLWYKSSVRFCTEICFMLPKYILLNSGMQKGRSYKFHCPEKICTLKDFCFHWMLIFHFATQILNFPLAQIEMQKWLSSLCLWCSLESWLQHLFLNRFYSNYHQISTVITSCNYSFSGKKNHMFITVQLFFSPLLGCQKFFLFLSFQKINIKGKRLSL